MIKRTFEITARIEQGQPPFCFQAVQNDKDVYTLHIRITKGDEEIDYTQVSDATITFALANGAVVQSAPERLTVSATGINYQMGTSEIACPGKVLASIQLFGEDGERLTTARFQFEVVADLISPKAVQSESHFPLLQQLVADVEQLKQDIVDLQIPDNSIMDEKLSNAAGQIKQRFASHMADYASHKADYASHKADNASYMADNAYVKIFGVIGDGITDDTLGFKALEEVYTGRNVDLLGKTYLVTQPFVKNNYYNGAFIYGYESGGSIVPYSTIANNKTEKHLYEKNVFRGHNGDLGYLTNFRLGFRNPEDVCSTEKFLEVAQEIKKYFADNNWGYGQPHSADITYTKSGNVQVTMFDGDIFNLKVGDLNEGTYEFTYDGSDWKLSGNTVDISEYGITASNMVNGDTITVLFNNYSNEVMPYLNVTYEEGIYAISKSSPNIRPFVSCASFIAQVLYSCGYTDIGFPRIANARVRSRSLPYYLKSKGWTEIAERDNIKSGDIVFTGWSNYIDDRQQNPGHALIAATDMIDGTCSSYDAGSQNALQNYINTYTDGAYLTQLDRAIYSGKYRFFAGSRLTDLGNTSWLLDVHRDIEGKKIFQIAYRPDTGDNRYTYYRTCFIGDSTYSWTSWKCDRTKDMLAEEYSATKTYTVGDFCWRFGDFYRCKTAITSPEPWDGEKWQISNLSELYKSIIKNTGTWTPIIDEISTPEVANGIWKRVGDIISLTCEFKIISSSENDVLIGGLPFPPPLATMAAPLVFNLGGNIVYASIYAASTNKIKLVNFDMTPVKLSDISGRTIRFNWVYSVP